MTNGLWLVVCCSVLVAGCATVEDRIADYRHLSCSELDQRIGRARYIRKEARHDQIVSDIGLIVGNRKERNEAALDGIGADIEEEDANVDLEALRTLKREKGCV